LKHKKNEKVLKGHMGSDKKQTPEKALDKMSVTELYDIVK
jgi:hypothetical protein